jgi:carboxymethylenebutenolidase
MSAFLAGHGFVVAVPEIYHELEPAGSVISYEPEGSARGNAHKTTKELASYDADARAVIGFLKDHAACTGSLGTMGVCIGGHLSYRAAMNPEILAAACFYATDIHIGGLGKGENDDSLARTSDIKGELLLIWGRQDPHVPFEGRTKIRARLEEAGTNYQWLEVNAAHAFMRDEGPRHDPAHWRACFDLVIEMFHQRLNILSK